jgi:hypothetical protein
VWSHFEEGFVRADFFLTNRSSVLYGRTNSEFWKGY